MKVLKKIRSKLYAVIKKMFKIIFSSKIVKINNKKIVFDNFNGKGYGCNPKYIAEEILRENLDYDLVWLVNDLNSEMPEKIRKVKYGRIKALYELATAKVWIDNVRSYKGIDKKEGQFYIQTWHAGIGLKTAEKDIEEILSPQYVKEAKYDGTITNLMLANNAHQENYIKKAYWYDGEIKCIGLPREDILYKNDQNIIKKVYNFYNIEDNKKIVMYAPTFRKEFNIDVYKFDYIKCTEKLKEKFGNEYVILLRLHPNVVEYNKLFKFNNKVIDASNYPDVQELIVASEIIISDYSSMMFEAALVNKPVFLFAKDLEEYLKSERKMLFKFDEIPFKMAKTEEELYKNIDKFSQKEYENKIKAFYKKIGVVYNPNSAKDVVDIIKREMENR